MVSLSHASHSDASPLIEALYPRGCSCLYGAISSGTLLYRDDMLLLFAVSSGTLPRQTALNPCLLACSSYLPCLAHPCLFASSLFPSLFPLSLPLLRLLTFPQLPPLASLHCSKICLLFPRSFSPCLSLSLPPVSLLLDRTPQSTDSAAETLQDFMRRIRHSILNDEI